MKELSYYMRDYAVFSPSTIPFIIKTGLSSINSLIIVHHFSSPKE
jgi:hypothetical protein